jgi:hydrogenase expression/formation protein HypC
MCLAIPGEVLGVEGQEAIISLGGVKKRVRLDLVDGVKIGDYVLVHTGFAIRKIPPGEAEETLKLFDEIIELQRQE